MCEYVNEILKLDEAVSRAIQLEAIYEAENGKRKQNKQPVRVQTVTSEEVAAGASLTAMLTRQTAALENVVNLLTERGKPPVAAGTSREGKNRGQSRGGKLCWYCGERGHFRSTCPKRVKSGN